MKRIIILLFSCLFAALLFSCSSKSGQVVEVPYYITDTIYIEDTSLNDERIKELEADVLYWKGKYEEKINTIPFDVYMNARKVEKSKYYIQICERNPKNKKFFFGWIRRTMAE